MLWIMRIHQEADLKTVVTKHHVLGKKTNTNCSHLTLRR